jgi:hypothetical protein
MVYDDGVYDDGMVYDDGVYDDGMVYDDGVYDDGLYDDDDGDEMIVSIADEIIISTSQVINSPSIMVVLPL